ncbi:MAG: ATP-binding protein [Pseudobdellovibrio sp.]
MSQWAKKLNSYPVSQPKTSSGPVEDYNRRILIVEDEPAIAEGVKNILSPVTNIVPIHRSSRQKAVAPSEAAEKKHQDHIEVVWAKTPAEALELVQESVKQNRPFAMGFFDVLLGSDIDGIELVRQIQLIDEKIFAVFVTAYHDRSVDSIQQILGADKSDRWDYINKPFSEGSILQKARNSVSIWNLKEQKKRQEEQLAEASHLLRQGERTNIVAAVGRSVAHEFGNLLFHIIGHAEIALHKNDLQSMHHSLATILKAGETATSVLDKFKKLNNHSDPQPEAKPISINQCINESVDLMAHEFNKRHIRVMWIKNHQCELVADQHSLIQVFINLFTNATHAMPSSGQIDISVSKYFSDNLAESCAEIRIRDHGPGIPENILPFVMNPFYTTKGKQGTGLGLAICKEIIEVEHEGEFSLSNHPHKGLEVIIRIPVKGEVKSG